MTASDKCTNQIKNVLLCRSHPHRTFAAFLQRFRVIFQPGAALLDGRDLLLKPVNVASAPAIITLIRLVKLLQIALQTLIARSDLPLQAGLGEVAILAVDRLDPAAVHRDQFTPEQIQVPAKGHEFAKDCLEGLSVIAAEIRNGLEIGLQAAQQPDDLDVAMRLGLYSVLRLIGNKRTLPFATLKRVFCYLLNPIKRNTL